MSLKLREYQEECLTFTDLALSKHQRVANVLPTGAGKTVVFSAMARRHLLAVPTGRVLVLAHTDELVSQAYNKIRLMAPDLKVGVVKAERDETDAQVVVGSVQTLRSRRRRARIPGVSLVIIDECQHSTAKTYRDIIEHFGGAQVVGFTATLGRSDDGDLSKVWETVAYRRDILWMIRNEYLVDVRGLHVRVDDLDLRKVKKSGGDFQGEALGQALSDSMAPEIVAKALREHGPDRQTICFTPLVATAYEFAEAFVAEGFTAEVVHGGLPKGERRAILARYARGETQVLCNAKVLTEGFDAPATSCVIVARPTKSKPLFQQMVGRGLRVDPDRPYAEQDCLLLIVAGAEMHDLRAIVDLGEKQVRLQPGQTLTEAVDELERGEGGARDAKPLWNGATKVKAFDPLMRASRRTWSHTAGTGTRFLPAGDFYIVLQESAEVPGAYDVCWCNKCPPYAKGWRYMQGRTQYTGIPLDLAMDWGEDVADQMGGERAAMFNTKSKKWRSSRDLSPSSQDLASALGVPFELGVTRKGELSEAIESVLASRRIDPMVTRYREYLKSKEKEV